MLVHGEQVDVGPVQTDARSVTVIIDRNRQAGGSALSDRSCHFSHASSLLSKALEQFQDVTQTWEATYSSLAEMPFLEVIAVKPVPARATK